MNKITMYSDPHHSRSGVPPLIQPTPPPAALQFQRLKVRPLQRLFALPSLLCLLTLFTFFPAFVNAAEPQVEATLSSDTVELGEQLELQIKITGARDIKPPERVSIEGLSIGGVSFTKSSERSNINGSYSTTETTLFSFQIVPQKTGRFPIPPIVVEADGKKLTTRPLKLTVTGGAAGSGSGGSANANPDARQDDSPGEIGFAELVVPKLHAYLGEAVPVELRIYFNAGVNVQIPQGAMPQITLDGFTMQKLTDPQQKKITRDGKDYNCLTFKTVVTPAKIGKLAIGPVEMPYVALVSVRRNIQRPRLGGPFDSMFNDPFFNGMVNMSEPRNLTARGSAVDLEVRPLPLAGKPKSFDGAIGQFDMDTTAKPLKVNVGDPITLTIHISGRGNFDRVNAPVIADESGWRTYPPSAKFSAEDKSGINGSKTFEMALIPEERKNALPVMEFSYFDPLTEKYKTLTSNPDAIAVEGQNPPPVVAQSAPARQPAATPAPTPLQKRKADDILYLADTGAWGETFEPVYMQRNFWLAQIVPAAALLAFAGVQIRRVRKNNVEAARVAALEKEKEDYLKTLNRIGVKQSDFFDAAVRYLQAETARTSGRNPASIGADDAIASRPLEPDVIAGVQTIFAACGGQRYAGGSASAGAIPDGKREKVLATIRSFTHA